MPLPVTFRGLPGAELWLNINNHSVKYFTDAIEYWYSVGERWINVFEKTDTENSDEP